MYGTTTAANMLDLNRWRGTMYAFNTNSIMVMFIRQL